MDPKKNVQKGTRPARIRHATLRFATRRVAAALAALALGLLVRLAVLSDDHSLKLVLSPYARAVELFFGYDARWEGGKGFVIAETGAVLTEECSGLGWFALAFPLLVFLFFPVSLAEKFDKDRFFRFFMKVFWVSALAAFASNLIRILASQAFGPIKRGLGLAFYSAHAAEGMLIFLAAFLACVVVLKRSEGYERE
jgi:exosortase K